MADLLEIMLDVMGVQLQHMVIMPESRIVFSIPIIWTIVICKKVEQSLFLVIL